MLEHTETKRIALNKRNRDMARSFKSSLNSAPFYYNTDNSSAISISQILLSVACSAGKVLKLYFSFTKQYKYNSSDSKNTQTMIETSSFTSPSHKWEMEKRKKSPINQYFLPENVEPK
jgi:hypothetical protein